MKSKNLVHRVIAWTMLFVVLLTAAPPAAPTRAATQPPGVIANLVASAVEPSSQVAPSAEPPIWAMAANPLPPQLAITNARPNSIRAADSSGNTVYVDLRDYGLDPETTIILAGQQVVWTNKGSQIHTITEGDPIFRVYLPVVLNNVNAGAAATQSAAVMPQDLEHTPVFDSGDIAPEEQYTYTFAITGSYAYYSVYSPGSVVGRVVVVEASEQVTESISASAGMVVTTTNGAKVAIAANGLYTDTVFHISVLSSMPVTSTWGTSVGPAYEISVDYEDAISSPMTITLPYDPSDLPAGASEDALRISYFDGLSWIMAPGAVDTAQNVIVVTTTHLSIWWILYPKCWELREESIFNEEQKINYEIARSYMKRLSAHKDLVEAFKSDEESLLKVNYKSAQWLAERDLCALARTSPEELAAEPLKVTVDDWKQVAEEMIDIGEALNSR